MERSRRDARKSRHQDRDLARRCGDPAVLAVFWLVFRANSFAAPVVKIQKGHAIATGGPYALVRHPMYADAILFLLGTPLLLGSWLGLALAPVVVAGFGFRAVMEEKTLAAQFPGCADYAARVRYRFVPLIW